MILAGSLRRTTLSFLLCLSSSVIAQDALNYVVSVIVHLAAAETGVPKCVFFGMSTDRPFGDVPEGVIRSPQLDHVTKYVLSSSEKVNYLDLPSNPTLMVVDVGGFFSAEPGGEGTDRIVNPFLSADPATKLLVLVDTRSIDFEKMVIVCKIFSFTNVIYLDLENHRLIRKNGFVLEQLCYMLSPESLFFKAFGNITDRVITFEVIGFWALIPDVKWVSETARFLGTAASETGSDYDLGLLVQRLGSYNQHVAKCFCFLLPATIEAMVIVIPRDSLTFVELFLMPFDWEVWLVVISILILSEGVAFSLPSVFRNDPILLVICGFEKHDMHKASRWEKMFIHSLLIFTFFTKCAYETKIISLMINRPSSSQIRNIEDLAESEIKVLVDYTAPEISKEARFAGMFIVTNDTIKEMDGIHGYFMMKESAKYLVPIYYDDVRRQSRYRIIEDPIAMVIRAYKFSPRNPLLKSFEYTYQVFTESGIMRHWKDIFHRKLIYKFSSTFKTYRLVEEDGVVLLFSDIVIA